jgi:glycosyltransferase involved in cell wall biosynthesis
MIRVSVIIPTFRRNDGFLRAAISVFEQDRLDGVELIAVDNSPEGAALELFKQLATYAPIPFRWAHEPRPGVSHARNAALVLARGDFIAWLDDDQKAPAHWLKSLLRIHHAAGKADCVFGPVVAHAPETAPHRRLHEMLYSRSGPARSGAVSKPYGIGNSLMQRDTMLARLSPFDIAANETGGEDGRLFADARTRGCTYAWAAEAGVDEFIDPRRLHLRDALKRAFAYGQSPAATALRQGRVIAFGGHIVRATLQLPIYSMATLALALMRDPLAYRALVRASEAVGALFWFKPQRFYGATLAKRAAHLNLRASDHDLASPAH